MELLRAFGTKARRAAGLALLLLVSGATAQEAPLEDGDLVRVPDFDHDGIEASYVVTLPEQYAPSRDWPLLIDLHGAISPTRQGAVITRDRLWRAFASKADCIVVGLNGRTRAWGMVEGERDDPAYVAHVLAEVRRRLPIDDARTYLSGFSSGGDFLCSGGLQVDGPFKGSLVICPGPPSVVGLRRGELVRAKATPFLFVAGEEDTVRKSGAWEAYLALDAAGGTAEYREIPACAHEFPDVVEVVSAFQRLETLASGRAPGPDAWAEALERFDVLLARKLFPSGDVRFEALWRDAVAGTVQRFRARAERIDAAAEPGRAYEAWWRIRTQFHHVARYRDRALAELAAIEKAVPRRDLYRARAAHFRRRIVPNRKTPGVKRPETIGKGGPWGFDRYLTNDEIADGLHELAERFPERATLTSMGRSVEGRDLWVLAVTDPTTGPPESKPAAYLQGGLHGNELSGCMTVLYAAWQLAANPEGSRGTARLLRDTTVYLAPVVNPDAVHHHLAEPHSHWRPRFNYRPFDADGDGKTDEDGYEDLDGDGEIGHMWVPDPAAPFVLKDGRLVRAKEGDEGTRYRNVGREGLDDDGDGKFSEDPPGGVDLNRNFPVGHGVRQRWEGTSGPEPASEPETRAIIDFVSAHPNIALFLDVHNDGNCLFTWLGPEENDKALYRALSERVEKALGYRPVPLRHPGAGLAVAWAADAGCVAGILELESTRGDRDRYRETMWRNAFVPAKPFPHPQLGEVLIGGDYRKVVRRNLVPSEIFWQADRVFAWLKDELPRLPRLELVDPLILPVAEGFVVTGSVRNRGEYPSHTERALAAEEPRPITITADGAELSGTTEIPSLGPGESAPFEVRLSGVKDSPMGGGPSVTVRVAHPRTGEVELRVLRPRRPITIFRGEHSVEDGYHTPDRAVRAENAHFANGVARGAERGPAFELAHEKPALRVAVLLGEWADRRHTVPADEFERAFFAERGYRERSFTGQHVYGSVRTFYEQMSHGALDVYGDVFDWAELPGGYAEYRDASFGSRELSKRLRAVVLARDGAEALDDYDAFVYVWAGNAVARTSMLWPMRLPKDPASGAVAFKMSELYQGEMAAIGVACHELAHTFGVNDKYGLGAAPRPLGPYCLIARGTHGAGDSGRHSPFALCAWCRAVIGWVEPVVVDPATPQRLALRPVSSDRAECFKVLLRPDGSEYLLLTNRRRLGFHAELPSEGLIVLRVGPDAKPSAPQAMVELIPAHGLPAPSRGRLAKPEAVAFPQPGIDELEIDGVRIGDIRDVDGVIHFTLGQVGD